MLLIILISFSVFLIGFAGIIFNKKNIIMLLVNLELILLSSNINFLLFSIYLDDLLGQVMCLLVLTIAACETAIGLSLIICYYKTYQYI